MYRNLSRCYSYSVLRSDVHILSRVSWNYCILDEGHLIKNPKTHTAIAAQLIRSKHKVLLSGSPVQNKVQELWAIFNWLMPNYLGSNSEFAEQFGRDITRSQLPGVSHTQLRNGMRKLKILHQQVLPFILRREKSEVLQQLPPKMIMDIHCTMSEEQICLYENLSNQRNTKIAINALQSCIVSTEGDDSMHHGAKPVFGKDALKSLMSLRMLCTHPLLLKGLSNEIGDYFKSPQSFDRYDASGKMTALKDLLTTLGIIDDDVTAADNDQSLIYVPKLGDLESVSNASNDFEYNEDTVERLNQDRELHGNHEPKCLIFAQFNQSLDIVEKLLFNPLISSQEYVRIDGRVDPTKRDEIVQKFVENVSVKCMLLTTKVGSLGLNLQVADTVIFLEPDYNPHVDLQAMDRVHRIGQNKVSFLCMNFRNVEWIVNKIEPSPLFELILSILIRQ